MKNTASLILSVLLGAVFLFSGIVKLFPVDFFESDLYTTGFVPWILTPLLARIIIGIELMAGIFLIFNLHFNKKLYLFCGLLLLIFTTQLLIQMLLHGNQGDCGCFGRVLPMTPAQGILKNIALAGILIILYNFNEISLKLKRPYLFFLIPAAISIAVPFITAPILISSHQPGMTGTPLPLDLLYNSEKNKAPESDLRKGKWVIAYFSLTCPHCKIAANKLQAIKNAYPEIPVYMVLNGDTEKLEPFLKETRSEKVPHSMFTGADDFVKMSTTSLPAIFLVNNSVIENRLDYVELSPSVVREWLIH
jgi:uncharacterized membrane protein YphA (DoxX/SURF4 family)